MPRKLDPNEIIDRYQTFLDGVLQTFSDLEDLTNDERLLKEISIDTFLRAAVAFETFRSDWHIAAINREPAVFLKAVDKWVKGQIRASGEYRGVADSLLLGLGSNLSVATIRKIVDPSGRNVAFTGKDGWRKRADRELAPRYAAQVRAISQQDQDTVTAVISIRNCVAHRSSGALTDMNVALHRLPAGLRRPQNRVSLKGIGAYLWASPPGEVPARATRFVRALRRIAGSLSVVIP